MFEIKVMAFTGRIGILHMSRNYVYSTRTPEVPHIIEYGTPLAGCDMN